MNTLRILSILLLSTLAHAQITEFLHVQGREVVTDQNEIVKLRGVNMDAYYWAFNWDSLAPLNYADERDIRFLDSLGANVIRLCLHWKYFNSDMGYQFIDNYLSWCDTSGIYVILDMHAVPPENDFGDNLIWGDTLAQGQLASLWKNIAARYSNRAVIAGYDLMNEPNPSDTSEWWGLAERIADSIRTVDTTHILFVEDPMAGTRFRLIDDLNVVYSYHDYSPFAVTHAKADWIGDTPLPDDYSYPGATLSNIEWVTYAQDMEQVYGQTSSWLYWDSGNMIVPANTNFTTIKPNVWSSVGDVWFDDLAWTKNGVAQTLINAGVEQESAWLRPGMPSSWHFGSSVGPTGSWGTQAHSGSHSLKITGVVDQWAVWSQAQWILTDPLITVVPGDTMRVTGWILAPTNNGGAISISCDYLRGVYDHYDRAHLVSDIQPYVNWSVANNVPIWCGEFGCMSAAPGNSRFNLIRDKVGMMNDAGIGWTMWSYRSEQPPSFALMFQDSVVEQLATILAQGFSGQTWPEAIDDLTIISEGADVILHWTPLLNAVSYTVYSSFESSNNLNLYTIIGTTTDSTFTHINGATSPRLFYLVTSSFEN